MVAVPFVSASTTCKECPLNGPRAWPRNSDGSITDVAPCFGASRDSKASIDTIDDAVDSTSVREEMLVPVARVLPDAGDTITGSIAHMRRRLKSPGGLIDRMTPVIPGRGRCPLQDLWPAQGSRLQMRCASLESWGNDCSTSFPKPRPIPCGVDLYEGRAIDPDPVGSVCEVSKGETLLILVNPLKTRAPALLRQRDQAPPTTCARH